MSAQLSKKYFFRMNKNVKNLRNASKLSARVEQQWNLGGLLERAA